MSSQSNAIDTFVRIGQALRVRRCLSWNDTLASAQANITVRILGKIGSSEASKFCANSVFRAMILAVLVIVFSLSGVEGFKVDEDVRPLHQRSNIGFHGRGVVRRYRAIGAFSGKHQDWGHVSLTGAP